MVIRRVSYLDRVSLAYNLCTYCIHPLLFPSVPSSRTAERRDPSGFSKSRLNDRRSLRRALDTLSFLARLRGVLTHVVLGDRGLFLAADARYDRLRRRQLLDDWKQLIVRDFQKDRPIHYGSSDLVIAQRAAIAKLFFDVTLKFLEHLRSFLARSLHRFYAFLRRRRVLCIFTLRSRRLRRHLL